MAVKTFSTGEVLTAADTNTYLNNGGLVYVTSQTIGSAVSSVTVSNCFSATYDAYKIMIINGGTASATIDLKLKMGSTATGYYGGQFGTKYTDGTFQGRGINNGADWTYAGAAYSTGMIFHVDLKDPYVAARTMCQAYGQYNNAGTAWSMFAGELADTTSYTSFTITPSSGTISAGTIVVYGYRKA